MTLRVEVAGRTVSLADEGPRTPDAVVLLHGFTGSRASWQPLAERIASRRRVVRIDLPGHGGTPPASDRAADSLAATASLVDEALAAVRVEHASLVGYSMGGRVALAVALDRPRRIERLLLESASPGLAAPAERQARRAADEALAVRLERDGIEAFVREWERLPLFASFARLPAAAREELRRQRLAASPEGLAASLRAVGTGAQPWLGARLGELAMPVTLVAGAEDAKFRAIAEAMAAAIRRARLELVPGAGHAPHLEQPSRFTAIVESFLEPTTNTLEESRVDFLANRS